ncbi:zinc-binding alcohol dehydrogenase family protein [Jatrophihabitans telluris]|uniref:Zinc-binding alcohol dehydrogenase family protein n=1 Tax=Jatrophihabitans telluris TaxID=2038343 RepID=A0ABY4QV81_9ACTN|nr:zinc-binding alcohol dehydrogenase family protein [Jatrophihabitans telluris]UQX87022.1 zinc-binding alcohol dehydrogenase family protein [Jatrophihabitans telluris]
MAINAAAWSNAKNASLEVAEAPYPAPGDDQIVVRNHAVAINPLDWIIQVAGGLTYRWLQYPAVIGSDLAGEVVEVGKSVTLFQVGDRVLAHAVGTDKDSNRAAEGAFQHYTVVLERMTSPLPDTLAYENAAVLPLAVSTAASALFQKDQLGLRHPTQSPQPTGQTVLIWGGSTSVGSNAIQLAVAAGYDVITTASPHNFDYVASLGASLVFDYNDPKVVNDLVAAFADRTLAGAIAIGTTAASACVRIAAASKGNKFIAIATPPVSFERLGDADRPSFVTFRTIFRLITSNIGLQLQARPRGVRLKYIFGTSLKSNEVSTAIYRDFLPAALAGGRYVPAPQPLVVGKGLHDLQHALDIQRKGVSAQKVVVTLASN